MSSVRLGSLAVSLLLLLASARAQLPQLPDQWFQNLTPDADGQAISFCVDLKDPGHVVDAAIAEAIAAVLLVDSTMHVVDSIFDNLDFDPLFFLLSDSCAVHMGFRLYSDTYPEWLAITRSMYEGRFVIVTANPDWRTFSDIPPGAPVGVVQGTQGDVRFILSNGALPAEQRLRRLPVGHPTVAFDALSRGTVQALLVWEPWWWWLSQSRPELAELHVIEAAHISEPYVGVGGVLLAHRDFVRESVDAAVGALIESGTIQEILDGFGYPARAR